MKYTGIMCNSHIQSFRRPFADLAAVQKCKNKFSAYLANKYKDIDNLNKAYGTVFWSQEYNSFDLKGIDVYV